MLCCPPSLKIAVIILEVIDEIFSDILVPDKLYSLVQSKDYLSDMNRLFSTIPQINMADFEDLSGNTNC